MSLSTRQNFRPGFFTHPGRKIPDFFFAKKKIENFSEIRLTTGETMLAKKIEKLSEIRLTSGEIMLAKKIENFSKIDLTSGETMLAKKIENFSEIDLTSGKIMLRKNRISQDTKNQKTREKS